MQRGIWKVAQLDYTLGFLDGLLFFLAKTRVKERVLQDARNRGRTRAREARRQRVRARYQQLRQAYPQAKKERLVEMLMRKFGCSRASIYDFLK
jgi:hypothetical protein